MWFFLSFQSLWAVFVHSLNVVVHFLVTIIFCGGSGGGGALFEFAGHVVIHQCCPICYPSPLIVSIWYLKLVCAGHLNIRWILGCGFGTKTMKMICTYILCFCQIRCHSLMATLIFAWPFLPYVYTLYAFSLSVPLTFSLSMFRLFAFHFVFVDRICDDFILWIRQVNAEYDPSPLCMRIEEINNVWYIYMCLMMRVSNMCDE